MMRYWLLLRHRKWRANGARQNTPTNTRASNTGRYRLMRSWLLAFLLTFTMPRNRIVWRVVKVVSVYVIYSNLPNSGKRGRISEVKDGHGARG